MENGLDEQYIELLKDILENGVEKDTRNGKTLSVFGKTIRYKFKDGKFPLLTTKKMYFKGVATELIWFLRGDTNIKFLLENDCNIWTGDAYKNYSNKVQPWEPHLDEKMFVDRIKTDNEFAKKWGELGPIYGKHWRRWAKKKMYLSTDGSYENIYDEADQTVIDQISILINDLKTNPDSRRLMVTAWNVGELDQCVLPPCHYGFQVYTRELSDEERLSWMKNNKSNVVLPTRDPSIEFSMDEWFRPYGVPKRAISLMWNQRSVDTPLGLPFNIASYGLLLEIIAKEVNMVPDELIGNLGDTHIYLNQIEGIKEQLTREPFDLPTLKIEDEVKWQEGDCLPYYSPNDFTLENYQSHPSIKLPLSN